MSYELDAYLAPTSALEANLNPVALDQVYRLTDELGLLPLCGTLDLDIAWPVQASSGTAVAHVSADYFGGVGSQSATVWTDGEIVAESVDVNTALRLLGVRKTGGEDEWDSVGLGRYRRTETWAAQAIRANRDLGDDALAALTNALGYTSTNKDLQEKVRAAAAIDLGDLGDEAPIPLLVAAVEAGGEQGLRIEAAEALAKIGGGGLSALARLLREDAATRPSKWNLFRSRPRVSAIGSGKMDPAELARRDPTRLFPIVHAFGIAGPAAGRFAEDLAGVLRHGNAGTRSEAAQALGRIGPGAAPAVPALIDTLKDEEPFVRSYAAKALGEIGPSARAASQALTACLDDDVNYVRESAAAALAAINKT